MSRTISAPLRSPRRSIAAALAIAAAGLAAAGAASPGDASAASLRCARGELCIYSQRNLTGGLYHFAGSDADLRNDRFEGSFFHPIVAEHAESVWNNGRALKTGVNDVALYTQPGFRGNAVCVRLGGRGDFSVTVIDNIESYRWVTRATCNSMESGLGK